MKWSIGMTKNEIVEISMERTMCYGPCPVYKVTFKSDGTAIYQGEAHVEKLGVYKGIVDKQDFDYLNEFMSKLKFSQLNDEYTTPVTDCANTITTMLINGDTIKKVNNYAESGPVEIWAIEKVIDGIINDIYWEQED
jgi:hypothetical protein